MIEIGNIVTLENGRDYLLLEELNLDNHKYVYTVRVLEDETPTSEYVIYEAIYADDGEYLKDIVDKNEYDRLVEEFKSLISEKMVSGEYDDMIQEVSE